VANGYFDKENLIGSQCNLGIINCATGGGLAQSLGIPASCAEQFKVIKSGKVKKIDCGKITYYNQTNYPVIRYFVNELQFGIGGTVVRQTRRWQKRLGGKLAFGLTTVSSVFNHPNQRLELEVNNNKKIDGLFTGVVVANGAYCGGGMNLAPGAETDDGQFNVLLIHGQSVIDRLIAFSKVYSGQHINNGKFSYFPAKKLRITSTEKVLIEADGELLGDLPCTVEITQNAIPVLIAN
jgi:diacylglycerol kinase family enzyme